MKHAVMVLATCLPLLSCAMDIPQSEAQNIPKVGEPFKGNKKELEELAFGRSPSPNKMAIYDESPGHLLYVAVTRVVPGLGQVGINRQPGQEDMVKKCRVAPLPKK